MTANRTDFEALIRGALATAGGAGRFVEERTDLRAQLGSSGLTDVIETSSRGVAIPGTPSIHITAQDPAPRATPEGRTATHWDSSAETAIVEGATRAAKGRRHPHWSATRISFHQEVWVTSVGGDVLHDVRRGSRVEIRVRVGGDRSARADEDRVLRSGEQPSWTEAFSRAFDRAEQRLSRSVAAKSGPTVAVFAPGVAGVVAHELIGHAVEGDVVSRGQTWIRVGSRGASPLPVTVIDDPRRGRGAWSIDDEGVATGETVLIDRGRTVGLLLDRASASALGGTSTGHGRRASYLERVWPRMGCTFIAAGIDTPDDILRETAKGVFIRRLAGGHTDPRTGRASFVVTDADRILGGRLAEALDPFILTLDGAESWDSIDRVAHDLTFDACVGSCVRDGQPIAVSVGAPTIRIGVVNVFS